MKKIFLSLALSLACISFAYTSEDISNANYLADQGIITKQTVTSKYRLDDKILRQEVIGMALKVKGVTLPENYTCKKYFADATKNDWICRAIELAADNGIITRNNKYANPGKSITRAEALAMVMKAGGFIDTLSQDQLDTLEYWRMHFDTDISWHQDIILQGFFYDIIDTQKYISDSGVSGSEGATGNSTTLEVKFSPNRLATRAEVFAFAKNIINKNTTELSTLLKSGVDFETIEHENGLTIVFGKEIDFPYLSQDKACNIHTYQSSHNALSYDIDSDILSVIETEMQGPGESIVIKYQNEWYSVYGVYGVLDDCMEFINEQKIQAFSSVDALRAYYDNLSDLSSRSYAYSMRSPTGVSLETFKSWYKNTESITFREDTLKDLGNNTYEFLVDMVESGKKSTYKVKSKVNLEKFTIDNISSVKQ